MKILAAVPIALIAVTPLTVPIASRSGPIQDRCEERRELRGELDPVELTGVLVQARSGSLEVRGDGEGRIRVDAVVCASERDAADAASLVVERRRDAAWIAAELPEVRGWGNHYVRMDLVIHMPAGLPADIRDSSGSTRVSGIAGVRIDDGSGSIEIEEVAGPVEVHDRSGDIRIREVGSVELEDGSGGIRMTGVRGSVHILDDGSGEIVVLDVTGDVLIDDDGSGSIRVEQVGGDFVVGDDGSGSIHYRDVAGRVQIPRKR